MQRYAIIVAGGSGTRMGMEIPKQFLPLAGKPLLMHTIQAFASTSPSINIILVIPEKHIPLWKELCLEYNFSNHYTIVNGGKERYDSVANGLAHVPDNALVAVHDGARPLVMAETIDTSFDMAAIHGAAIPVTKPKDSVRIINQDSSNVSINRDSVRLVQTPQTFRSELLKKAYHLPNTGAFTDDASVMHNAGFEVFLFNGNETNIKITTPADLLVAGALMSVKNK